MILVTTKISNHQNPKLCFKFNGYRNSFGWNINEEFDYDSMGQ